MNYNYQDIKNKIETLRNNNPNITSIYYGYKTKGGKTTDELSIVYSVEEKKPISEIPENELIPSSLELHNGQSIKTDVVVIPEFKSMVCNVGCGDESGSGPNRQNVRPLKGGVSIRSQSNISSVGTFGFIAVDVATQALVGITNNHVSIGDAFYTAYRTNGNIIENDTIPVNTIWQSGDTPLNSGTVIGQSLRYVPIHQKNGVDTNDVDVAMFSLTSANISLTESFKQVGESYSSPLPFATTSEIDNLLTTNPMLYSSGRTTGPKGGPTCPLRVLGITAQGTIKYKLQGVLTNTEYVDGILFVKPVNDPDISTTCINPIKPGDSGSVLIADFGGVRKIVGLVFAGSANSNNDTTVGWACRIDRVAQQLGIEAWDGTLKNYVNPSTVEYKTVVGTNKTKLLTCGGKTYWQSGVTNLSSPC